MISANQSPYNPYLLTYFIATLVSGSCYSPPNSRGSKTHGHPSNLLKKLPYDYKIFPKSEPIWLDIGLETVKTAYSLFLIHLLVMIRIPVKDGTRVNTTRVRGIGQSGAANRSFFLKKTYSIPVATLLGGP